MPRRRPNMSTESYTVPLAALNASSPAPPNTPWRPKLLAFHQLPEWMRDNEYIHNHYRPQLLSYLACFRSLGYLHNETGNVYSHLVGAATFVGLAVWFAMRMVQPDSGADPMGRQANAAATWAWADLSVVFIFCACAIFCMGCSALFHLVSCHSARVSSQWNKCDYLGIVFMIIGSFYPAIFFAFYCHPVLQGVYLGSITVLGVLTSILCLADNFRSSEYRTIRAVVFSALGCAGIVPAIHAIASQGLAHAVEALGIHWMAGMGAFYLVGALIYAARFPERYFPGKFDLFLHSHQIFHLFVVAAAWFHYVGVMHAFDWLHLGGLADPTCASGTVRGMFSAIV